MEKPKAIDFNDTVEYIGSPEGKMEQVVINELVPGTVLTVFTKNSEYIIHVLNPETGEVEIVGGKIFTEPHQAVIAGSTSGMLIQGAIQKYFRLELNRITPPVEDGETTVITSPIKQIAIENDPAVKARFGPTLPQAE